MKALLVSLFCLILTQTANAAERIYERQLDNGLKVIVNVDTRSPVAVFSIWYKVGSSYEPAGQSGLSHMLEHMIFKGTEKHPEGEFSRLVSQLGGEQNAMTGPDLTVYFQKWSNEHIEKSFYYEADRMKNLVLDEQKFKKENNVVQEERRLRIDDKPIALTYERLKAAAHIAHPYHHPIIGWMNDIKNMTLDDLKAWYKTWYVPNNAVIVISGNVEPEKMFQLAEKHFGSIPAGKLPQIKPQLEPKSLGTRTIQVEAPAKLPYLLIAFNTPNVKSADEPWEPYALAMLATVLSGGDSARLPKNLVRDQEIAVTASADYQLYARFNDLFTIGAIPSEKQDVETLKKAILAEIEKLKTTPVSEKELKRIQAQAIAEYIYRQDSLFGRAFVIGYLESLDLPWKLDSEYAEQIKKITPAQLQETAKKYFTPQNMTVAVLKPKKIESETTVQMPIEEEEHG